MTNLWQNSNIPCKAVSYGWKPLEARDSGRVPQPMTVQEYELLLGHFTFATQQNTRGNPWYPYNEDTNCSELESNVRWALAHFRDVDFACNPYTHPFDFEASTWDNSLWECWYSWISKFSWAFFPVAWRHEEHTIGLSFIKETPTNFVPFFITAPIDPAVIGSLGFIFFANFQFYKPHIVEPDLTEIILYITIRADNEDDTFGPSWNFQLGVTLADHGDWGTPTVTDRLDVTGDAETFSQLRKVHISLASNCTSWAMALFQCQFDIIPM